VILNSEEGDHHLDLKNFETEGALNVNLEEKL
jgi:hypothetical protein